MASVDTAKPTWPLGLSFIDHQGRTFDVVKTIYGNPNAPVGYTVVVDGGGTIQSELGAREQTYVGFVERDNTEVIIQPVADMDRHMANGYIRWI